MRYRIWCASLLGIALMFVVSAGSSHAQTTRTWISGDGDDANTCSRSVTTAGTGPCKTFAGAIAKTATGGEIDTLDPGGFGSVTVTKSITLASEGTGEGGILVAGTNGITVNCATDPNCTVVVRGLQIDGGPIGSNSLNGIRFVAAGTLIVQNTVLRNFTGGSPNGYGISFQPNSAAKLVVTDSTIQNNGQPGSTFGGGIFINPAAGGSAKATILRTTVVNNILGIRADASNGATGPIAVTVQDCVVGHSVFGGIVSFSQAGQQPTTVIVQGSTSNSNGAGLNANGPTATLRIGSSIVTNNNTAYTVSNGATMTSFGNNQIIDNPSGPTVALPLSAPN